MSISKPVSKIQARSASERFFRTIAKAILRQLRSDELRYPNPNRKRERRVGAHLAYASGWDTLFLGGEKVAIDLEPEIGIQEALPVTLVLCVLNDSQKFLLVSL